MYFVLVLVQDCLDIFWRVVLMKEVQRLKRALRLGWEWIEFGDATEWIEFGDFTPTPTMAMLLG
jgi:hypothetical protein